MAKVAVPVEAFRTGMFPRICAKTGGPAYELVDVAARFTPGRFAAVLSGFVPWVALGAATLPGRLPYSSPVAARRAFGVRLGRTAMPVAVAAYVGAFWWAPLGLLALAAFVAAVAGAVLALGSSVRAQVVAEGQSVRLYGVSTAFAEAIRAQGLAVDR